MKGILINGSPKRNGSASGALLEDLRSLLDTETETTVMAVTASHSAATSAYTGMRWEPSPEEQKQLCGLSFLVLSFPLYVDGIPSHLLSFLTELEWQQKNGRLLESAEPLAVYAAVNCGFYEGKQAAIALRIVENWCVRCGFEYKQGIGCGAGAMLPHVKGAPLQKGIKKPLGTALKDMAARIEHHEKGMDHLISLSFPRPIYIAAAHIGWKKQGRENGLTVKELRS
ncbi:hypothetical protein [Hungatella hathewayi]|uniref:hypothetical protein n=1 Tax=Hungatella hathewayi TaxID=154046 RepID=UPI003564595E